MFCRGLKSFLEQALWPEGNVGVVSVYCPQPYARRTGGFHRVDAGWEMAGAVACIFPNRAARSLLTHLPSLDHRRNGPDDGMRHVDSLIGRWAKDAVLTVYYHSPSLVQHIGTTSTVWPGATNWGLRHSHNFVGEDFDAMTLVTAPAEIKI